MTAGHALAAVLTTAALLGASAPTAGDRALEGSGVVFTVFENLPPNGACPGLYAVDAGTREISWLGGFDAATQDFAIYPGFTAAGRLSYGYIDRASNRLPLLNIYVSDRLVAPRGVGYTRPSWSPRREELAFGRLNGGEVELAIASAAGSTRRVGPPAALWPTWAPDGNGLVYTRGARGPELLTFVSRDGRNLRNLARNVRPYPAPQVSPDGKRVAFVRSFAAGTREELWLVATRGGGARRVLGPAGHETLAPVAWLSNRELLVQNGGRRDTIFDAGDRLVRLDVVTGRTKPFLSHAFGLALSPDRSRLLFVRRHLRAGETYYSIRTVGVDGRDEQLLAVTDEEDLNIGSVPVWKPESASVDWVGDPFPFPQGIDARECVRRVTALRDSTR